MHASAWPLHLIRTFCADHRHLHKRYVICLLFVCVMRSVRTAIKSATLRSERLGPGATRPPQIRRLSAGQTSSANFVEI